MTSDESHTRHQIVTSTTGQPTRTDEGGKGYIERRGRREKVVTPGPLYAEPLSDLQTPPLRSQPSNPRSIDHWLRVTIADTKPRVLLPIVPRGPTPAPTAALHSATAISMLQRLHPRLDNRTSNLPDPRLEHVAPGHLHRQRPEPTRGQSTGAATQTPAARPRRRGRRRRSPRALDQAKRRLFASTGESRPPPAVSRPRSGLYLPPSATRPTSPSLPPSEDWGTLQPITMGL